MGRVRTSTDGSGAGTPRRTAMGIRSSISYSPAPPIARTPTQDGLGSRAFFGSEPRRSLDSGSEGRDLMGLDEEVESEEEIKGETLTDRYVSLSRAPP